MFANFPDGRPWRLGPGPNRAFTYDGIPVEVLSGYVAAEVDDLGYYEWTFDIPEGATLVRPKPR